MRLFLAFIVAVFAVFVSQPAFSATATTIDELAKMYDVTSCIECHEDQAKEWKDSKHGNAVVDSNVLKTWRTFITQGLDKEGHPREWMTGCLQCHAPQIKDASPELVKQIAGMVVTAVDDPDKAKRESATKELSKLNINCLACHNLNALGMYAKEQPKPKAVYGPEATDIAKDAHKEAGFETIKSTMMKKAELCATCHHGCPEGSSSTECPTQYTGYIEDYIQKGGKETCQGCHMKKEKDYTSHKFLGSRDLKLFETWIDLTVNARPTTYIDNMGGKKTPAIVVKVAVTNKAGHGIPHG